MTDAVFRHACRWAAGVWVVLSALFLAQPAELTPGISFPMDMDLEGIAAFWEARPDRAPVHIGLHGTAVLTALLTLAVVVGTARRLAPRALVWAAFGGTALLVTALSNVRYLAMEPTWARLLLEATGPDRNAVAAASATLALDPFGILEFGCLAAWMAGVTVASSGGWVFRTAGAVGTLGLAGMVVGAAAWPPALDVAPLLGTPGLVAWLVLLPSSLQGRSTTEGRDR